MLSRVDHVTVKCNAQFYNNKNVYIKNQGITVIGWDMQLELRLSSFIYISNFRNIFIYSWFGLVIMVFNAIFNNISVISWRSVLLVEETLHGHYSYQGQRERKRKN
jgi:hypothetical protein